MRQSDQWLTTSYPYQPEREHCIVKVKWLTRSYSFIHRLITKVATLKRTEEWDTFCCPDDASRDSHLRCTMREIDSRLRNLASLSAATLQPTRTTGNIDPPALIPPTTSLKCMSTKNTEQGQQLERLTLINGPPQRECPQISWRFIGKIIRKTGLEILRLRNFTLFDREGEPMKVKAREEGMCSLL